MSYRMRFLLQTVDTLLPKLAFGTFLLLGGISGDHIKNFETLSICTYLFCPLQQINMCVYLLCFV